MNSQLEQEEDPDLEEYKALTSTLLSFYNFHKWEYEELIEPRNTKQASLSEQELNLIPWYPKHTSDLEMAIGINEEFTKSLAMNIAADWGVSTNAQEWAACSDSDYDKVRSSLLQLSREWSTDGEKEREITFGRIIKELTDRFPNEKERQNIKILVPGCGLGRLVLDLVKEGFWCQGNEFSYHMLLTSNFMLNHCKFANSYSILPFVHKQSHVIKRLNQLRPITIPDVNPTSIHELATKNPEIPYGDLMSMTAGSFVDLYGPPNLMYSETYSSDPVANQFRTENHERFDVLATCFFLDTASNIIDYLKAIFHCLKPGGIWINFGPLLWHFEDDSQTHFVTKQLSKGGALQSIPTIMKGLELTREDLIELVKKIGFIFEKHESDIETSYSSDIRSLGTYVYKCESWVCRKPSSI